MMTATFDSLLEYGASKLCGTGVVNIYHSRTPFSRGLRFVCRAPLITIVTDYGTARFARRKQGTRHTISLDLLYRRGPKCQGEALAELERCSQEGQFRRRANGAVVNCHSGGI